MFIFQWSMFGSGIWMLEFRARVYGLGYLWVEVWVCLRVGGNLRVDGLRVHGIWLLQVCFVDLCFVFCSYFERSVIIKNTELESPVNC